MMSLAPDDRARLAALMAQMTTKAANEQTKDDGAALQ